MSFLTELARRLGGEVVGRQVHCPGPGHSARDRSLIVWQSPNAPGGFTVYSHAGDDFRECRDHVAAMIGAPLFEPGARRRAEEKGANSPLSRPPEPPTSTVNAPAAQALWNRGRSIVGTVAEIYLTRRAGTDQDASIEAPSVAAARPLGSHAGRANLPDLDHVCRFVADARTGGERFACLVTLCTDPLTNEPTGGVHRTFLAPDGSKAAPGKKMLGPAGIARLWPDEEVTTALFLAEGIETGLAAALGLGLAPLWAGLTAGAIERFPVLAGIETLTVIADNDASGTGMRVAKAVCQRWRDAGREASILIPEQLGDAADVLGAAA